MSLSAPHPAEAGKIAKLGYPIEAISGAEDFPPADAAYHNYAEMVTDIQQVAAAHPDMVIPSVLVNPIEGRELWAAKISDNVATDEDEPEVLFIGQHHAREHITVEMTLYILHLLASNMALTRRSPTWSTRARSISSSAPIRMAANTISPRARIAPGARTASQILDRSMLAPI